MILPDLRFHENPRGCNIVSRRPRRSNSCSAIRPDSGGGLAAIARRLYSTHALSLPSYACDRIHRRLRSDLLRVLSYSGSWVWDFQIPLWLYLGRSSSLHPLVSKPAFNLHAGMPVESKPTRHPDRQTHGEEERHG